MLPEVRLQVSDEELHALEPALGSAPDHLVHAIVQDGDHGLVEVLADFSGGRERGGGRGSSRLDRDLFFDLSFQDLALHASVSQLFVRAGVAGHAVVFQLAMRAGVAVFAASLQLPMRAGVAVFAVLLHPAMRARVAVFAVCFLPIMPAPLVLAHRGLTTIPARGELSAVSWL